MQRPANGAKAEGKIHFHRINKQEKWLFVLLREFIISSYLFKKNKQRKRGFPEFTRRS